MRMLLAALLIPLLVGCGAAPTPIGPNAAAPTLRGDAQVLHDLDCYNPMYQLDADGHVIKLRLPWRHLPTPVMTQIGKLRELKALDLASATVNDDGLAQLKDLRNLRSIGLTGTQVTDKGLFFLEKLPSLEWVWLSKGLVTVEGKEKLEAARPDMHVYLN